MKQIMRADGAVRIRLPDSAGDVIDIQAGGGTTAESTRSSGRRSAAIASTGSGASGGDELDIMLEALSDHDSPMSSSLEVVDRFAVDVGDGNRPGTTRRGAAASADKPELNIELDLQPGESAVILVEQDGTYEWHYPAQRKESGQRGRRAPGAPPAGSTDGSAAQAQLSFRIPIGDSGRLPRPTRGRRTHRGPITGFIKGKIQGFILKFVAQKTIGALTRRLERGVSEGPVVITSATDAMQWTQQAAYPVDALPAGRARRILLLVHGTFSSTLGSFGALSAFSEGQTLLQEALQNYDLVVGFDHYTLSETPDQNAEDLLAALLPLIADGQSLEIDAIAFSRGGLVYRYLSEVLIPNAHVPIVCRKAVFVGCTNSGTELANDDNWKHLIDFYTNMIAGATRLIGLAPGAALPARILRQGIKVIGSLVTYMAQDGVSNNSVPGVAAMEPAGDFIRALNTKPPNRATAGARAYYAIGSNFEPSDSDDAFQLGKRLVLKIADGFVDKLMGRANDLVVNNDSMFVIDPVPGARLLERRSVDANGRIYHTVYFHQSMVASACSQWLGMLEPEPVTRSATARSATPGALPRSWWAEVVSDDFTVIAATSSVGEAIKRLRPPCTELVVVQRLHEGSLLYHGFTRHALVSQLKLAKDKHVPVGHLLGLHEWKQRTLSVEDAVMSGSPAALRAAADELAVKQGGTGADLAVIVDDGRPAGIVLPADHPAAETLSVRSARIERAPVAAVAPAAEAPAGGAQLEGAAGAGAARGATGATRNAEPNPTNGTTSPQRVWCNMHAVMPEEVALDAVAAVEVSLSRDLIARETGISGAGEVATDQPLIIQALARKHCDIVGSDRLEIAVPEPGEETAVYFDIKALHIGVGEIDVIARQGNQPIINLKLRPRFIKRTATAVARNTAVAGTLVPVTPRQQLPDVLYIYDVQVGAERILEFNFQSRQTGLQGRYRSTPFKTENARQDYVANLYKEIEEFWADDQNDYDAFMQHLMARGANLFDKLVPTEIQQRLWDARDTLTAIQVISDEPFIPWELLYLKQPGKPARADSFFLVEKGLLRWVSNMDYAPTQIRFRDGHFKHIVPRYPSASGFALPGAQAERKMLEDKFSAAPIKPDSKSVHTALTTPQAQDILHFACHGLADSASIWNSGLMMQGKMVDGQYVKDDLTYEWTSMMADLHAGDAGGPLVFLNACQSGRHGYNLTGTGGFAQAFVKAGASAFIGSHWSVGDQPAVAFSETLYTELLENGSTIMDAVSKARSAAKNNQEVTWLAYAVYADPYARIVHQ